MSVKGSYTAKIFSSLSIGQHVWAKLPYGDFIVEVRSRKSQDVVLVAGGTGLAPFVPLLEELVENGHEERKLALFYGVRSSEQLMFQDLLRACAERNLVDVHIYSEAGFGKSDPQGMVFKEGRLDPRRILADCGHLVTPSYFLSGLLTSTTEPKALTWYLCRNSLSI